MRKRRNSRRKVNLSKELRGIILSMLIPLLFCVMLSLFILGYYEVQYAKITHNVNISSKFNLSFKYTIDLKMYHYTVGSKLQTKLPLSDVDDAIKLAEALRRTTYRKESRRTIGDILDYCYNLRAKMINISNTKNYDSRKLQLENNIYVLTNLIKGKINDYIYYEAGYMADTEKKMIKNIQMAMLVAFIFVSGTTTILLLFGMKFARSITSPVSKLCNNVNSVGEGTFTIPQVEADYYEIAQLNSGIQKMASRINLLLENVKEEEKLQHLTQLRLIQAQINPHFLYNTLDTIVWLVESERYDEAVTMLSNLSVFFRTTLSKGHDIISLGEEIMHTQSYLKIQQVRYQDILDYNISIPEHLKEVKVPKLTIQPLAENALYHGVKEKRGRSTINITCEEVGNDIRIVVSDNGIGMQPEQLSKVKHSLDQSERVGFGLAAVHERVKLYFGDDYGIHIKSDFGYGTTVEVLISKNIEQES